MQSVSSRIWTRVAVSISYDDNHYTTGTNECPGYDNKKSDGETPVMLDLWKMQSTPWLPSLPGPLWHEVPVWYGVVAPDRNLYV